MKLYELSDNTINLRKITYISRIKETGLFAMFDVVFDTGVSLSVQVEPYNDENKLKLEKTKADLINAWRRCDIKKI